jgi:ABC-type sugar transport system substrate-binding protein
MPGTAAAEPEFKVGFLAGGDKENNFWVRMGQFAEAVAEDLNIDLEVVYPPPATYPIKRAGLKLIEGLSNQDYLITVYFDSVTNELLEIAEDRRIHTFLINTDILKSDREKVGRPREIYKHWIGHMRPDDVQAGYQVADAILNHFDQPETVRLLVINGNTTVQVAFDRELGLKQRLEESPGAKRVATGMGNWEKEPSRVTTAKLLKEHPEVNAIWAGSDPMALGAIEAINKTGKRPGRDIVTASIDWTNEGLKAVRDGEMLANVGGHFMEAGIALMLMYDYHNGHDFNEEMGVSFRSSMYRVSEEQIDDYFETVGTDPDWSSIDFKQFTKTHNPDRERYDFSWKAISGQLR